MPVLTRRIFIGQLAACGCLCCAPSTLQARSATGSGCAVDEEDFKAIAGRGDLRFGRNIGDLTIGDVRRTTGDARIDRILDQALKRIADMYGVLPGFGFYDDEKSENAFAMMKTLIPGTKGTVLFGMNLFKKLMKFDPAGAPIIWTAAHEFGHIWLMQSGLYATVKKGQTTNKRTELHADYLAGFYLGSRKRQEPQVSLYKAGADLWEIGDENYTSADHHGTPSERVAASEAGFLLSYRENRDAKYAFQAGLDYVMQR